MKTHTRTKFALAGIALGLIFPPVAWLLDIASQHVTFSVESIIQIHQNNIIHYVVDFAPIVLGVVFFFFGNTIQPATYDQKNIFVSSIPKLREIIASGYFLGGIFLALCFWILESAFDVYMFDRSNSFLQEIVNPDVRELYFRSIISVGFIAFGFITGVNTHKVRWAFDRTRLNEERVSLLLNSAAEGIYGIDLNGECIFANMSCLEMLGYQSEKELLGKDMHRLIHHTRCDGTPFLAEDCKILQALRAGEESHVDCELLWRMDGTSFPAEYRSHPVRSPEGTFGSVVTFTNIEERVKADAILVQTSLLNKKTANATTSFLKGETPLDVFTNVLDSILELTESEFGFIGDVSYDQSGAPYLKTRAITNIAWDQASGDLYQPEGMEFRNLDTLFGHVLTTKTTVLSNSPAEDERAGGLPRGHPPLNAFLGIPLMRGEELIGMLGVGNRPGGYDESLLNFIEPFVNACAYILWGMQLAEEKNLAEERLLGFFNVSEEGILFHKRGIITDVNPKAAKITGYDHDEMVGQNVLKFIAPESREMIGESIATESTNYHEYEITGLRKDGSEYDVELQSQAFKVRGTKQRAVSFRDVTARKTLESEREQAAHERTQLIDTANAPIIGVNLKLQINEWNHTAEKMTGYERDEVMGCSFLDEFIDETHLESVIKIFKEALGGCETASFELNMKTKSGENAIVQFNTTTRRDVEGAVTGVICIGQDITEQRQKESSLNQAQKMEAVGQLTGGIAHDFNNLLSIVKGNLRFLQQDISEASPEIDELFEDAMSAVDDGAELTQRLLGFSRARTLKPEIKNVNDVLEKFARFMSRTLGAGIEMGIDIPDKNLFINVDPSQLENALLNLSINARDALPNGGSINLSATQYYHGDGDGDGDGDECRLALARGNYIKISVIDTGTGIRPEDLERVYEPFFTTKEVGKGSGLGLSMVYGFTRQSDGVCSINSTLGIGTTVSMYFHEVMENKTIKKSEDNETSSVPGSKVILVVEDEPRVRRVTLRDLKNLGYKTLEAENAAVARSIIDSGEHIDLMFSDILMPGEMDGYDLGIWTRENYPQIGVVLTSGYSKDKVDVSPDAFPFPLVRKPYVLSKLAAHVRTTLAEDEELSG